MGSHSHGVAPRRQPLKRSGQAAPQRVPCARLAPDIAAGRSGGTRCSPPSCRTQPAAVAFLTRPEPPRPLERDSSHFRATLAAAHSPWSRARTAHPLQRGRGSGSRGQALPGRSQARGAPAGERGAYARARRPFPPIRWAPEGECGELVATEFPLAASYTPQTERRAPSSSRVRAAHTVPGRKGVASTVL